MGESYVVDAERSYELPKELADRARQEMERSSDRQGKFCKIWLFDEFAAKSPRGDENHYSFEDWYNMFQRATIISQDLIPRGVRTPKIYGVSRINNGKPFLVMDKLPQLRTFDILPPQDADDFINSYFRQWRAIVDAGYITTDHDYKAENPNCGFNREDREAWFYDLDFWKKA